MAIFRVNELVIGELEIAVCNALWDHGEADVHSMHERIGVGRGISSNTVQSALDRLYRKRVLSRRKVGSAYVYAPALNREQFAGRLVNSVASVLGTAGRVPMLSAFVEFAGQADPAMLGRLEALIADARKGGKR